MSFFDNSTGIWTGVSLMGEPGYCSGKINEIFISDRDKNILIKLAEEVANLASKKSEEEKRKLWYAHNDLKTKFPVILCDPENGWNEIITGDSIACKSDLARRWEYVLRKKIFYGKELMDDTPIERVFDIAYTATDSEWGAREEYKGGKDGGSYVWDSPIKNEKDIFKIKVPVITIDHETTLKTIELAQEIFKDLLEVRLVGIWWWSFGMSLDLIRLIGFEKMLIYMCDKPDFIHKIMRKFTDGYMAKLDYLEKNNLLILNNDAIYIGTGGLGYTKDLPVKGRTGSTVKTMDLWGNTESQETVGVSAEMFEEFIFKYQLEIQKRFGLNCYGCCEPLEKRWKIIKNVPNLRRVSVSAWADRKKMADFLEDKYIYSWKPRPTDLAISKMDRDRVRNYIRETLEVTKGCILEIVMKDNHTIGKNPKNVTDWVKIAREEVTRIYS